MEITKLINMKCLYFFEGKSKNRRVNFYVIEDKDGLVFFHIKIKRLVDFASRQITSTDNIYSYATFRLIFEMMSQLMGNNGFKIHTKKYIDEMKDDTMKVKTNVSNAICEHPKSSRKYITGYGHDVCGECGVLFF